MKQLRPITYTRRYFDRPPFDEFQVVSLLKFLFSISCGIFLHLLLNHFIFAQRNSVWQMYIKKKLMLEFSFSLTLLKILLCHLDHITSTSNQNFPRTAIARKKRNVNKFTMLDDYFLISEIHKVMSHTAWCPFSFIFNNLKLVMQAKIRECGESVRLNIKTTAKTRELLPLWC